MPEKKRRKQPSRVSGSQHTRNRVYGRSFRNVRPQVLARDGYLCQVRSPVCTKKATCVDHIRDWKVGGSWYDPANLRAACTPCNAWRAAHRDDGVSASGRTWADCRWPGEYVGQLHPMNWSREWHRPSDEEISAWHDDHGLPPWRPDGQEPGAIA
jgi:5-methylcytosine-specific restriction endonuclease McrA